MVLWFLLSVIFIIKFLQQEICVDIIEKFENDGYIRV